MSIGQVLLILWRRSWLVALTFLTALIVAAAVLWLVPGRYDATATASIDPSGLDPVSATPEGGATAIGLMQGNMLQLVSSQRVALDVVKRLNLTANPRVQNDFRNSNSFGRESIDEWMAESLQKNVDPKFNMGTNVLSIKYKTGDPNQAALIANAFLASTIDATIAMKAASGDQTARWFAPQLDDMRKELETARGALESYQKETNLVAPTAAADTESSALMTISAGVVKQQGQRDRHAVPSGQQRHQSRHRSVRSGSPITGHPQGQVVDCTDSGRIGQEFAWGEQSKDGVRGRQYCGAQKANRRRNRQDARASQSAHRPELKTRSSSLKPHRPRRKRR